MKTLRLFALLALALMGSAACGTMYGGHHGGDPRWDSSAGYQRNYPRDHSYPGNPNAAPRVYPWSNRGGHAPRTH